MTSAAPQRARAQSLRLVRMRRNPWRAFGLLFPGAPGRDGGARNPRFPFYRDSAPAAELASRHVSKGRRRRAQGMLTLGGSSLAGVPAA
jgi:hypothetical protein